MNSKIFAIIVGVMTSSVFYVSGQQTSAEIDKRLEELKTIWHQEQTVINGFTRNRTVPVKEGSKEYYACLEASKRIQHAEKEAAELKEKRNNISPTTLVTPTPEMEKTGAEFDFEKVRKQADEHKNQTLVFKGFYLGMPGADTQALMNHYMGFHQTSAAVITLTKEQEQKSFLTRFEEPRKCFQIFKTSENFIITQWPNLTKPLAVLDGKMKLTEFRLIPKHSDQLFKAGQSPLDEFIRSFSEAYGIKGVEMRVEKLSDLENEGVQTIYYHRSSKGFEWSMWGERSTFGDFGAQVKMNVLGIGEIERTMILKQIQTSSQIRSNFD